MVQISSELRQQAAMLSLLDNLGKDVVISTYSQFYSQWESESGVYESRGKLISVTPFFGFSLEPPLEDALHVRECRSNPYQTPDGNVVRKPAPVVRRTIQASFNFVGLHSLNHSISTVQGDLLYESTIQSSPVPGTFGSLEKQASMVLEYRAKLFGSKVTQEPKLALQFLLDYHSTKEGVDPSAKTISYVADELCLLYEKNGFDWRKTEEQRIRDALLPQNRSKSDFAQYLWDEARATGLSLNSTDYFSRSLYKTIGAVQNAEQRLKQNKKAKN